MAPMNDDIYLLVKIDPLDGDEDHMGVTLKSGDGVGVVFGNMEQAVQFRNSHAPDYTIIRYTRTGAVGLRLDA